MYRTPVIIGKISLNRAKPDPHMCLVYDLFVTIRSVDQRNSLQKDAEVAEQPNMLGLIS